MSVIWSVGWLCWWGLFGLEWVWWGLFGFLCLQLSFALFVVVLFWGFCALVFGAVFLLDFLSLNIQTVFTGIMKTSIL